MDSSSRKGPDGLRQQLMELQSRAASIVTDARALHGRCDGASCALMKRKRGGAADAQAVLDSVSNNRVMPLTYDLCVALRVCVCLSS